LRISQLRDTKRLTWITSLNFWIIRISRNGVRITTPISKEHPYPNLPPTMLRAPKRQYPQIPLLISMINC
jgi:hypothetical protein